MNAPKPKKIKMYHPNMEYRRFGKTNEYISSITLGGMRFTHGWDAPRELLPQKTIQECLEITQLAFEHGINHIETAYGYGKSETCYGLVLNDLLKVPRKDYYLMTKGRPTKKSEVRALVERQLKDLKTDYIDFYAYHGINEQESFDWAFSQGVIEEFLELKKEGVIRHLGFSTHGKLDIIKKSVLTNAFDFFNVHYYYFLQRNYESITLADQRDMGVFIISPNDKGGRLYSPSKVVSEKCHPYSPIQWNALFCLAHREIHTLSFGFSEKKHFNELSSFFKDHNPSLIEGIKNSLDKLLPKPYCDFDGYLDEDPSGIYIGEFYRFWKLWKFYEMDEFVSLRYNSFSPNNSFIRSAPATDENIKKIDTTKLSTDINIIKILKELHQKFYQPNL